jgi:hypothetical protein
MKALGYIWNVTANIMILCAVVWALDKLEHRSGNIVVAVLGMIYVTMRTTQGFQTLAMLQIAMGQQEQMDEIRTWIDGTFQPDRSEELTQFKRLRAKFYINCFFLGLISLMCVLVFFGSLMKGS